MSLNNVERHWRDLYENASPRDRSAVDAAFEAARRELVKRGIQCDNCDRAEAMVAMLYRYIIESRDEDRRAAAFLCS